MNLEKDYLEYIGEFSLSLLAISSLYFLDPSNPKTFPILLVIPFLYGYTARISREGFQTASLLSLIAIMFAILSPTMAVLAILVSIGNILVSVFANGSSFTSYYSATTLPLLLTGIILGGAVYGATVQKPSLDSEIRSSVAGIAANQTSTVLEETKLMEQQRKANRQMVKQTASGTITLTRGYVLNQTRKELSPEDQQVVIDSFRQASSDIPRRLTEGAEKSQKSINISDRVKKSTENLLKGNMIVLIPLVAFFIYGTHPVLGFLTAIFASLFAYTERKLE